MPRLPQPGGDAGNWGQILNDYLSVEHNTDGSLKDVARPSDLANKASQSDLAAKYTKPNNGIPKADLEQPVRDTLDTVATHTTDIAAKANQTDLTATNTRIDGSLKADGTLKDTVVTRGALAPDVAAAVLVQSRPITVIGLGTSITNGGAVYPTTPGSSWTHGPTSYLVWMTHLSQGRLKLLRNAGVGSNRTNQMLARIDADVIAYKPDLCIIEFAANDVSDGTPLSTIATNIIAMHQKLQAAGIRTALTNGTPRASSLLAATREVALWAEQYAAANGLPLIDTYGVTADPSTGEYKAGYSSDTLHPTGVASREMGREAVRTLLGSIPTDTKLPLATANTDPANWLANPLMVTDTNADGVPDGWVKAGSATATTSLDTDAAILGKWMTLTATSAGGVLLDTKFAAGSVGDVGRLRLRVKTSGIEAGSGQWYVSVAWLNDANAAQSASVFPYGVAAIDIPSGVMDVALPPKPATATKLNIRSAIQSGQGSISIAQVRLAKEMV